MRLIELKSIFSEGDGLFYHLTDAQLRSRQEPEKGIFIDSEEPDERGLY